MRRTSRCPAPCRRTPPSSSPKASWTCSGSSRTSSRRSSRTAHRKIREEKKEKNQSEFNRLEIKAVHKGIKIVGGDVVAGSANKHLSAFMQTRRSSFVEVRTVADTPNQLDVDSFLCSENAATFAKRQHLRTEELKAVYKAIKIKVQPR